MAWASSANGASVGPAGAYRLRRASRRPHEATAATETRPERCAAAKRNGCGYAPPRHGKGGHGENQPQGMDETGPGRGELGVLEATGADFDTAPGVRSDVHHRAARPGRCSPCRPRCCSGIKEGPNVKRARPYRSDRAPRPSPALIPEAFFQFTGFEFGSLIASCPWDLTAVFPGAGAEPSGLRGCRPGDRARNVRKIPAPRQLPRS